MSSSRYRRPVYETPGAGIAGYGAAGRVLLLGPGGEERHQRGDHRRRRRVADRGVHDAEGELPGGAPGREGQADLRRQLRPVDPDPAGRPGRRVRIGVDQEHGRARRRRRRPEGLRREHGGDRRPAQQSGRHRHRPGSREAGSQGGGLRPDRALRSGGDDGLRQREDHREAGGQPRRRQVDARRGRVGRGRRRHRLRHRRPGREGEGDGCAHPGRRERRHDLPDRGADAREERHAGQGVGGLRALGRGAAGAEGRRLPAAVKRSSATRRTPGLGTPLIVVPPAVLAVLFLALPTAAILVRTPWSRLGSIYHEQGVWTALRISVVSSLEATTLSLLLGVPLAWALARVRMPGVGVVRAIVTIPLVLPPVIGGVALFAALGRNGILGDPINALLGSDLPFTFSAIVFAQTFVAMPFLVITVEGAFRIAARGVEEAAATLGASRSRIFLRVPLPLVLPAILLGAVLCWARALGEFGATLLVGGNVRGVTQTLPTLVLSVFNNDPADAPALALPLIVVAVVVIGALRDTWLRPMASA